MEEAGDGAKASSQDARGGGAQAQGRQDVPRLEKGLEVFSCPSYPICGPIILKFSVDLIIYGFRTKY